jgi:hypothetical protein
MTATKGDALRNAKKIGKITGLPVELHHNDTTPFSTVAWMVGKIGLGLVGACNSIS